MKDRGLFQCNSMIWPNPEIVRLPQFQAYNSLRFVRNVLIKLLVGSQQHFRRCLFKCTQIHRIVSSFYFCSLRKAYNLFDFLEMADLFTRFGFLFLRTDHSLLKASPFCETRFLPHVTHWINISCTLWFLPTLGALHKTNTVCLVPTEYGQKCRLMGAFICSHNHQNKRASMMYNQTHKSWAVCSECGHIGKSLLQK